MSDDTIGYNRERWDALSQAGVEYSRPWLDLDPRIALERVDPERQLENIDGLDVLCLAASGGQQSAAFGLLGARATVLDASERQLEKDRATAAHYNLDVRTEQGDMQDLSRFADESFDLLWLAHSINFVPHADRVIAEAARVLRSRGRARIHFTNPYVHGAWDRPHGDGYLVRGFFEDGGAVTARGERWEFADEHGTQHTVEGPIEYRHSLSTIVNRCIAEGLSIDGLWECLGSVADPEPATWDHFERVAPPWLVVWTTKAG